ncbi:mannosyltransferase [Pseudofulvibacter geojedonensis]|uniref:Mannosyltransferase n=1 Tax=Pseudofulvibacter geojedonensis TaxID=1123758 RepID=A0ABW3I5J2_9FLAO
MIHYLKKHKTITLSIITSVIIFCFFAYQLERRNFYELIFSFSFLFGLFLYQFNKISSWKLLVFIAIAFRLIFLFAIPNLSQDFYRFIWDGRMLLNGLNPYLYLPQDFILGNYIIPNQANELVNGMQELNASHYSNYPPLNQLCFLIAALLFNNNILGSIIVMRVLLIVADIGILYIGKKLLISLNLNPKFIFFYLLNPFIIIELIGNLHFEGFMIFFLLWGIYLFQKGKWKIAALLIACSISIKLLPLLFLPLFFSRLKINELITFYSVIGGLTIIFFIPFLSEELIHNYSKSIGLWFGQFEFNGSFHNLIKYIGKQFDVINITKILGKTTPILVFVYVIYLSLKRKIENTITLISFMVLTLSFYLFTTATVHPWYVAMLLALSIFTKYRFPLVWSFSIMLSYSFYRDENFSNNYLLLFLEYAIVFGYMMYEFTTKKNPA